MIGITGANGQLGRAVVDEVLRLRPKAELAVSVRDPHRAADLADRGVHVRAGDYDQPDSLRAAFGGVSQLLLMPTPIPDPEARIAQHLPVIAAAIDAGVSHIVYPGAHAADKFDNPLLQAHDRIAATIRESGASWTILGNAIYADVIAQEVLGAEAAGELAAPAGAARVAPVLRRDLASATAAVLTTDGHADRNYELTAPDTVDWNDLAAIAADRSGTQVRYRPVDSEEARARLVATGAPDAMIAIALGFYDAYRAGWCGTPSADLGYLCGLADRQPASAADAVRAAADGAAH